MIETKNNSNRTIKNTNNSLPVTATGYNTTSSYPNYNLSGNQPNYAYNNRENLNFNTSGISQNGFSNQTDLQNAVNDQQKYINNYNNFKPQNTFEELSYSNNSKLENLRDFSQHNVKDTYNENKPVMFMLDTKNKHNTLYDNLNDNLMKETIQEVRLNIDTYDRDVEIYPNPFDFVVNLGPVVNSGLNTNVRNTKPNIKQELKNVLKNNNKKKNNQEYLDVKEEIFVFDSNQLIVDYDINLKKINNPYLNRNFDNVKFIRLDSAVIPKYIAIAINKNWDYCRNTSHNRVYIKDDYDRMKDYVLLNYRYVPDETAIYNTANDRFLQIYIKELQNNYNLGTNPITDKSFIMINDKNIGILYWLGKPYSAIQTYKDSLLGNINKLTIQFYDSWGNPLSLNYSKINYEKEQILSTDLLNCDILSIDNFIDNIKSIEWIISKITNILKCFIIINFDISLKIPFYSSINMELSSTTYASNIIDNIKSNLLNTSSTSSSSSSSSSSDTLCVTELLESNTDNNSDTNLTDINYNIDFNPCFIDNSKIILNQSIFKVNNIYKELNEFVSTNGFITVKKTTKTGKIINVNIDQYINNVIWFDNVKNPKDFIEFNLKSFTYNYKKFGFNILDTLKKELLNIPISKVYQSYVTFVMGIYTNELNTKTDFNHS